MPLDNRREFTRVGVPMWAQFEVGQNRVAGPAVDVSMNGLFLETARPNLRGTGSLEITFDAAEQEVLVRGRAEVVRNLGNGLGLRIIEIELESYDFLKEVLMRHAADPRQVELELDEHVGLLRDDLEHGNGGSD